MQLYAHPVVTTERRTPKDESIHPTGRRLTVRFADLRSREGVLQLLGGALTTPYEGAFDSRQAIPSTSAATASMTSMTGSKRNRKTAKVVVSFCTSARSSVSRTA